MSQLEQPQRRRDLTAGYIHENAQQNGHNWPEVLTLLVLSFTKPSSVEGIRNSYLKHVDFSRKHTWKFQYDRGNLDPHYRFASI